MGLSVEARRKLLHWLEHGSDIERRHARARLAIDVARDPSGPPPAPVSAAAIAALSAVKACPHRSRDAGCGCSGHRCAVGKGRDGIVTHRDCLSCVGLAIEPA